ncbi:MAG: deoxyribose-phosphate aldolase [Bacteroidota bacterium]|nr:deoxyribose-phosphate aldolase [Bacteroidota bacterium]
MMSISQYIDHTLLKPVATEEEIIQLCRDAVKYNFYAVCVNSCYVDTCRNVLSTLDNHDVKIASVAGFPLGAMDSLSKINEAENAVKNGAHEIDMVINVGSLRSKKYVEVEYEIKKMKEAIGHNILKVIIETCYLTGDEKKIATQLVCNAEADFVKTSTGFGSGGATIEDILLMKNITQNKILIKASGGIKDYKTALMFIKAGATRIGTSNGIQIVNEEKKIHNQEQ